jgi:hypothetical protein
LICAPSAAEQGSHTKAATAEQTWNLIMGLMKDTVMNDRAMREGKWQTQPSRGLVGKTLGLLGLGAIGQQVAEIANAMRMRVIAWSPHLTAERARAHGAEYVAFEQIFTDSDIVSLHAPMLPENRDMVGEAQPDRDTVAFRRDTDLPMSGAGRWIPCDRVQLPAEPFIKSKRRDLHKLKTVDIRVLRIDQNVSFDSLGDDSGRNPKRH